MLGFVLSPWLGTVTVRLARRTGRVVGSTLADLTGIRLELVLEVALGAGSRGPETNLELGLRLALGLGLGLAAV